MNQRLEKPDFCVEVQTEQEYAAFGTLLEKYDRAFDLKKRYENAPGSVRAFYAIDAAGHPFAALALYEHDPWNRTVSISCISVNGNETEKLIAAIQWVTGIAVLEMGAEKVCTLIGKDSEEYASFFLSAGYSYDGFLRDHLLLSNGQRSDAFLISILKHEYERQHFLHCKLVKDVI